MRKLATICAMAFAFSTAAAQTIYIWKGSVATAVGAAEAGDILYANGTTLNLLGTEINIADIDSITLGNATLPQTVKVSYHGSRATVAIPFALSSAVSATVSGAYVTVNSTAAEGEDISYSLSGTSADGGFIQNGVYKCTVALEGLDLTSKQGAAIEIANGKRIKMILADGTTNSLADFADGIQRGCLRVKGHPEFEGAGTLNITGNANHGISTGEYMEVKSGNINILSAVNDGIHCGQYFKMRDGKVKVNAGGDGIQAEVTKDPTDTLNGQMIISGGEIDVNIQAHDVKAVRCDSNMTVSGGKITVNVKGDGVKGIAADGSLTITQDTAVPTNIDVTVDGGIHETTDPVTGVIDQSKTRGIRVKGEFNVFGGTVNVTATGTKSKTINVDGYSTLKRAASVNAAGFMFDKTIN